MINKEASGDQRELKLTETVAHDVEVVNAAGQLVVWTSLALGDLVGFRVIADLNPEINKPLKQTPRTPVLYNRSFTMSGSTILKDSSR